MNANLQTSSCKREALPSRAGVVLAALFLAFAGNVTADVRYVDLNNPNPSPPFTSWAAAATNIQDAVDAAVAGDQILVTNGVYQTGSSSVAVLGAGGMNRVAVTKALTVQSVNGPAATYIVGERLPSGATVRCAFLTNGASIAGFTLTNGSADWMYSSGSGAGVWAQSSSAIVSNCVLTRNYVSDNGGGSFNATLISCVVSNNDASLGGGAFGGMLIGCTIARNHAIKGGGAISNILDNCTLTENDANSDGGGSYFAILSNCTLERNNASWGGGSYGGTLSNCEISNNLSSAFGGGVARARLNNCSLSLNTSANGAGAYLSSLTNCTLTYNWTDYDGAGGGTYNCTNVNCTLAFNQAHYVGGGAYQGLLINCALVGNIAYRGGGAVGGRLNNCTIFGNNASIGGGVDSGLLRNCIVYYNTAPEGENYDIGTFEYSCTTPIPTNGVGNITNAPLFLDTNGWANLRLQSNSPCINAGNNAYVVGNTDLDGRPRIVGGTVDIGAYEFQPGISGLFLGWLQQYSLPTDGSADYSDSDSDFMNNWQEWIAGTVPTDAASALRLLNPTPSSSGATLTWQSVTNRTYSLERSDNLTAPPAFSVLASNILGQTGTTSFTDTNAVGPGPFFYHVGVR